MSNVITCLFAANGFDRAAQGMIGAGQRLADAISGQLQIVVIGAADESLPAALRPLAHTITSIAFSEYLAYNPAVLAYNAFTRANRLTLARMDGFAHDLHAFLTTGLRGRPGDKLVELSAARVAKS